MTTKRVLFGKECMEEIRRFMLDAADGAVIACRDHRASLGLPEVVATGPEIDCDNEDCLVGCPLVEPTET